MCAELVAASGAAERKPTFADFCWAHTIFWHAHLPMNPLGLMLYECCMAPHMHAAWRADAMSDPGRFLSRSYVGVQVPKKEKKNEKNMWKSSALHFPGQMRLSKRPTPLPPE